MSKRRRESRDDGLAFDTLARLGAEFNVPVLAGVDPHEVESIPTNTIFATVTDQHWVLCIKGEHKTIVFDPLGLPISTLARSFHGVPIIPWNEYGYQSMFSSVCGYYIVAALVFIKHGNTLHDGTLDKLFMEICPHHIPRPNTISSWYKHHRKYNTQLEQNDQAVVQFVLSMYPKLAWLDQHITNITPHVANSGMVGSPIYRHAGIHAPTVHDSFTELARIKRQRTENVPNNMTVALDPTALVAENPNVLAFQTAQSTRRANSRIVNRLAREGPNPEYLNHAGPPSHRPLTRSEQILWARARLNAYNPPSGVSAAGNVRGPEEDAYPENIQGPIGPQIVPPAPVGPEAHVPPARARLDYEVPDYGPPESPPRYDWQPNRFHLPEDVEDMTEEQQAALAESVADALIQSMGGTAPPLVEDEYTTDTADETDVDIDTDFEDVEALPSAPLDEMERTVMPIESSSDDEEFVDAESVVSSSEEEPEPPPLPPGPPPPPPPPGPPLPGPSTSEDQVRASVLEDIRKGTHQLKKAPPLKDKPPAEPSLGNVLEELLKGTHKLKKAPPMNPRPPLTVEPPSLAQSIMDNIVKRTEGTRQSDSESEPGGEWDSEPELEPTPTDIAPEPTPNIYPELEGVEEVSPPVPGAFGTEMSNAWENVQAQKQEAERLRAEVEQKRRQLAAEAELRAAAEERARLAAEAKAAEESERLARARALRDAEMQQLRAQAERLRLAREAAERESKARAEADELQLALERNQREREAEDDRALNEIFSAHRANMAEVDNDIDAHNDRIDQLADTLQRLVEGRRAENEQWLQPSEPGPSFVEQVVLGDEPPPPPSGNFLTRLFGRPAEPPAPPPAPTRQRHDYRKQNTAAGEPTSVMDELEAAMKRRPRIYND